MNKKFIYSLTIGLVILAGAGFYLLPAESEVPFSESEQELEFETVAEETVITDRFLQRLYDRYPDIDAWQRPKGPVRVGLQIGHYKNSELPDELERLRGTSLGTSGGGTTEVAVNKIIAELTAELLEETGILVDILPATIPPGYYADAFVAIHADGNVDSRVSGFKASGPWRDYSGGSEKLNQLFYEIYPVVTGLGIDDAITRNMRGYYAFNWWRNEHALHPKTPAVILETGFLTSPVDQRVLVRNPDLAAQAIRQVILEFLDM